MTRPRQHPALGVAPMHVKTIGSRTVPLARIRASRDTTSDAPGAASILVPGSMVNVAPGATITVPESLTLDCFDHRASVRIVVTEVTVCANAPSVRRPACDVPRVETIATMANAGTSETARVRECRASTGTRCRSRLTCWQLGVLRPCGAVPCRLHVCHVN